MNELEQAGLLPLALLGLFAFNVPWRFLTAGEAIYRAACCVRRRRSWVRSRRRRRQ